jgi:hypothetical protein
VPVGKPGQTSYYAGSLESRDRHELVLVTRVIDSRRLECNLFSLATVGPALGNVAVRKLETFVHRVMEHSGTHDD